MRPLVVVLALGAAPSPGEAAEDADAEVLLQEFFLTEPVYPQERGEIQLTLGAEAEIGDSEDELEVRLKLEYGITNRFQLELEIPSVRVDERGEESRSGLGDVEVGAFYALSKDIEALAVSVALQVSLPTGTDERDLGTGKAGIEPVVILARRFGWGEVHTNLGASLLTDDDAFVYAAAAALPVGDWRFTAEGAGDIGDEHIARVGLGLVWAPNKGIEAGLGFNVGVTNVSPNWGTMGMLTFEW